MIKCLIFDCDGTLVESEHLGHLCMEIQLAEHGIREPAIEMERNFRGWKLHEILNDVLDRNKGIKLPENFIPDYRLKLIELFKEKLQPVDGVEEQLKMLPHPKCVASSGPMSKIKASLQITGLKKYFNDRIFSAYDINSWKPQPDLFLHAAEQMGFKPHQCLVVEDSEVGITAANAAGAQAILYNPDKKITPGNHQSFIEIKSMHELSGVINRLTN